MTASKSSDGAAVLGRLFTPGAARFRTGTLTAPPFAFAADNGETVPLAGRPDVRPGVGATPWRAAFDDGHVFETADGVALAALCGTRRERLARWERLGPHLIGVAVATLLAVFVVLRFGVPALASVAAALTPGGVSTVLDTTALVSLDRAVFSPSRLPDADIDAARADFATIAQASGIDGLTLHVRHAEAIGPNAFALPGGSVIVTDALVRLLSARELKAVMAHEVGHVADRHSLRLIYRIYGTSVMIGFMTGDFDGIVETLAEGANALTILANSRAFERDADRYAVALAQRMGDDPLALALAFAKIRKALPEGVGGPSMLSTHPGFDERIAAIRALAATPD